MGPTDTDGLGVSVCEWEGSGWELPDGHRIFATRNNGRGEHAWAIADESGGLPEDTDDGVLWLDQSRPLGVGEGTPTIPLRRESDGAPVRTITDPPTILMLSRMLRWTIADEARGHTYNVR